MQIFFLVCIYISTCALTFRLIVPISFPTWIWKCTYHSLHRYARRVFTENRDYCLPLNIDKDVCIMPMNVLLNAEQERSDINLEIGARSHGMGELSAILRVSGSYLFTYAPWYRNAHTIKICQKSKHVYNSSHSLTILEFPGILQQNWLIPIAIYTPGPLHHEITSGCYIDGHCPHNKLSKYVTSKLIYMYMIYVSSAGVKFLALIGPLLCAVGWALRMVPIHFRWMAMAGWVGMLHTVLGGE